MAGPLCLSASLTGSVRAPIFLCMKTVTIREALDRFNELARDVEKGETVTVTRDGKPVFDIVPRDDAARSKGGVDWEAGQAYLRSIGVSDPFPFIADDFDDPLPEDFLLQPLP